MSDTTTTVLIADDHPLVREGVKQLLAGQQEFTLVAEASTATEVCDALAQHMPDVAILDLSLGTDNGTELIKWTRQHYPTVRIVVLTMQDEALYAERLLRLGISAYIMKSTAETDLLTALRKVARGQRHISADMGERLLSKATRGRLAAGNEDPVAALTGREVEVFRLIGYGVSTREISSKLTLSMKTVDAHRRRIREKLNLRTTGELVRYATQWVNP